MTTPVEEHLDRFGKFAATLLKLGIFVGGACVVAYSLRIGRFPQGLTIGDSVLLVMAAMCFGAVVSTFTFSLVGLGITLSPVVRLVFWLAAKCIPSFAKAINEAPYALARMSWFAGLGAFLAVVMIFMLAQRDVSLAWNLPLLSIALYFFYSIFTSANSQIVELNKIVGSRVETPSRTDYRTLHKMSTLKTSRWAAPLFIITVPLLFGGATGEVLDASMRAAKIRIESPTVYIKQPFASLMPTALIAPVPYVPDGYAAYKGVIVLFHGFGTVTVLSFNDGTQRRTLDIPNEHIIVERG